YIPVTAFAQSLLSACAAGGLRSAPGAIVFTVLLGAVPIALASYLRTRWSETVPRHITGAAAERLAGLALPCPAASLPRRAAARRRRLPRVERCVHCSGDGGVHPPGCLNSGDPGFDSPDLRARSGDESRLQDDRAVLVAGVVVDLFHQHGRGDPSHLLTGLTD